MTSEVTFMWLYIKIYLLGDKRSLLKLLCASMKHGGLILNSPKNQIKNLQHSLSGWVKKYYKIKEIKCTFLLSVGIKNKKFKEFNLNSIVFFPAKIIWMNINICWLLCFILVLKYIVLYYRTEGNLDLN